MRASLIYRRDGCHQTDIPIWKAVQRHQVREAQTGQAETPNGRNGAISLNTPPNEAHGALVSSREILLSEMETKVFTEHLNFVGPKVLCKDIRRVFHTRYEEDFDSTFFNDIADVVVVNVNVFGAALSDHILRDKESTLVVTADGYRIVDVAQFGEHVSDPHAFTTAIAKSHILGIFSRWGIRLLLIRAPNE